MRKKDGKRDGKKDADLKVHFRLGKEMSAKEWMALGGIPSEAIEGAEDVGGSGSVDNFIAGVLVNCNVGPDAQTCLV
jgi:hypothetical protein